MSTDTTTAPSLLRPQTAVLALRQGFTAARKTGLPVLGQLGDETAVMRRSALAALLDDIDAMVGLLSEALGNIRGVDEWLPDGQALLDDALTGLETAGVALEEIHTGLIDQVINQAGDRAS